MKVNILDLNEYKTIGAKVFIGRDRGRLVREESNVDRIEVVSDVIKVIIPKEIYSINESFLEELFVNAIIKLGKEGFLAKFQFISLGDYDHSSALNNSINNILKIIK